MSNILRVATVAALLPGSHAAARHLEATLAEHAVTIAGLRRELGETKAALSLLAAQFSAFTAGGSKKGGAPVGEPVRRRRNLQAGGDKTSFKGNTWTSGSTSYSPRF